MPGTRHLVLALGLGLAASLLGLGAHLAGVLRPVELVATDMLMRARGPAAADPRVVICDIDAVSVHRYGRWPWARTRIASLIDRLAAGGARVIAVDVLFAEPSRAGPGCDLTAEDQALADAMARAGNVVLGFFFRARALPGERAGTLPESLAKSRVEQVLEPPGGFSIPRRQAVEPNLDLFARAAAAQGFFSHERESGVLRHYQMLIDYGGSFFPALALRAVQRFEAAGPLALGQTAAGLPEITIAGRPIETDEAGALWIDYRGPAHTFKTVSVAAVLQGGLAPGALRDKLVFVGASEPGIGDTQATPFGGEVAGVEIHANVADNLLSEHWIHDSGLQEGVSLAALLALGPLVALLVAAVRAHLVGSLLAIALVLLWPFGCWLAFATAGWHLQVVSPVASGIVALIGALRYQIGHVEQRARQIKKTFQRFVSESVVEEMLRHPERVKLGGERRQMTVLFSDIRGFTSISETLDSEALVSLLNEFFTPMTRLVLAHGGTLDKYMGDALMAFFGAPVAQTDHALRACGAALAMRAELGRLNAHWHERGTLPPDKSLGIGIGINSGEMSVGNMGSEAIFDYTVIGDNVNLGSRIEGLNKLYGTTVIVSEYTAREAGGAFLLRELDLVQVKGKQVPVAIYELLSAEPAMPADRQRAALFAQGVAAYRGRDFGAAEAIFGDLADRLGDRPAAALRERCRDFLRAPPPAEWRGVEVLTAK